MKRGIIALLIVIAVAAFTLYQYFYITSSADIYIEMLSTAEEQIEQNAITDAQETVEKLDHRFTLGERTMEIFLQHSDVSEIALNIAMLRRYSQTGDISEFLAVSAVAKRQLINLSNAQTPCIENIL